MFIWYLYQMNFKMIDDKFKLFFLNKRYKMES